MNVFHLKLFSLIPVFLSLRTLGVIEIQYLLQSPLLLPALYRQKNKEIPTMPIITQLRKAVFKILSRSWGTYIVFYGLFGEFLSNMVVPQKTYTGSFVTLCFQCLEVTFINLFIYYVWLCWVSVSMRGLSPVLASGGHSSSRCVGLSLSRPLPLRKTGSRRAGSVVVAHGPSRCTACGILPDQGSNPCPLALAGRLPTTAPPGEPLEVPFKRLIL